MKSPRRAVSVSRRLLAAALVLGAASSACGDAGDGALDTSGSEGTTSSVGTTNAGAGGAGTTAASGAGAETTGGGGAGGEVVAPADFEIWFDNTTPEVDLRAERTITLYVSPNSYEGTLALLVGGMPAGVEAKLASSVLTLEGGKIVATKLSIVTQSDAETGDHTIGISANAGGTTSTASATLTVRPSITVWIPQGVAGMLNSDSAFGAFPTMIKAPPGISAQNPLTVNFFNSDSVPNQIHASNPDQGFGHGNVNIPPGQFDPMVRKVTAAGTYNYYPHGVTNGATIRGRIIIE